MLVTMLMLSFRSLSILVLLVLILAFMSNVIFGVDTGTGVRTGTAMMLILVSY